MDPERSGDIFRSVSVAEDSTTDSIDETVPVLGGGLEVFFGKSPQDLHGKLGMIVFVFPGTVFVLGKDNPYIVIPRGEIEDPYLGTREGTSVVLDDVDDAVDYGNHAEGMGSIVKGEIGIGALGVGEYGPGIRFRGEEVEIVISERIGILVPIECGEVTVVAEFL